MPSTALSRSTIKMIGLIIDKLYARAKHRYLGPQAGAKQIAVTYNPVYSLPGVFSAAASSEASFPDEKMIAMLTENVGNYLDAYRAQTKAKVVNKVQSFLTEAALQGIETDVETVLGGELAKVWSTTTSDIKRLVDTETQHARNLGGLDGMLKVNAAMGIEDPTIMFVLVRDQHACGECKRLHLLEDGITPRVWKLSEVGHGYHKKGDSNPKIAGLHPNCRCASSSIFPGYGFNDSGMVTYISKDHDEFAKQRGLGDLKKDEFASVNLAKMAIKDIKPASKEEEGEIFTYADFSHVLTPLHRAHGYELHVRHNGGSGGKPQTEQPVTGVVKHKGFTVGRVAGFHDTATKNMTVSFAELDDDHHGKGLGKAMYTALFAHGFHKLGTKSISGSSHSSMATRVHQSIAKEHGLEGYKPEDKTPINQDGAFDEAKGPYRYTLKSEEELGESLEKSDWNTHDFVAAIKQYGWEPSHSTGEVHFKHPTVPRSISHSHSQARKIPIGKMKMVCKDAGLKWSPMGISVDEAHPYAVHYRASGHLAQLAPAQKTWTPAVPHQHVEIGSVVSTKPALEHWKVARYKRLMNDGEHGAVPPISVLKIGEEHHVVDGDEQLQAAKDLGHTHVPIRG